MNRYLVVLLLIASSNSWADEVTGWATVVDGQSIKIEGQTYVLDGLEVPSFSQKCAAAEGGEFACGRTSRQGLKSIIGGRIVRCVRRSGGTDCYVGSRHLNGEMVARGFAWATAPTYKKHELKARAKGIGLWKSAGRKVVLVR